MNIHAGLGVAVRASRLTVIEWRVSPGFTPRPSLSEGVRPHQEIAELQRAEPQPEATPPPPRTASRSAPPGLDGTPIRGSTRGHADLLPGRSAGRTLGDDHNPRRRPFGRVGEAMGPGRRNERPGRSPPRDPRLPDADGNVFLPSVDTLRRLAQVREPRTSSPQSGRSRRAWGAQPRPASRRRIPGPRGHPAPRSPLWRALMASVSLSAAAEGSPPLPIDRVQAARRRRTEPRGCCGPAS